MVAAPHTGRPARLPARQLSRRWSRAWRRLRYSELSWVITLGVLSAVAAYVVAVTDVIVPVTS